MFDVLALGEALIDFTPAGLSPSKMNLYERNPGGAPANVLCALSRLGRKTAFIGKVGDDAHGRFLRAVLEENNVDTQGLVADASVFTTLAFVELSGGGERSFSFARKPGADARLTPEELRLPLLENCRIFHFGSLSLTDSPSRAATLEALAAAKKAGARISFDPNYRAGLWDSEAEAVFTMRASLALASLVKISLEEMFLLTNKEEEREGARFILDRGASCVVITMGARGAAAFTRRARVHIGAPEVPVVDTTGAGDAFWGAFLHAFLSTDTPPESLTSRQLEQCVRFANAAASLSVQKHGAIPSLPSLSDVLQAQLSVDSGQLSVGSGQ